MSAPLDLSPAAVVARTLAKLRAAGCCAQSRRRNRLVRAEGRVGARNGRRVSAC